MHPNCFAKIFQFETDTLSIGFKHKAAPKDSAKQSLLQSLANRQYAKKTKHRIFRHTLSAFHFFVILLKRKNKQYSL